jgi:hypothetical protein
MRSIIEQSVEKGMEKSGGTSPILTSFACYASLNVGGGRNRVEFSRATLRYAVCKTRTAVLSAVLHAR